MENNAKISLTIYVAGSTRHCLGMKKIPWELTKQDLASKKLPPHIGKQIVKRGIAKVPNYVYEDASIHINLSRAAYDYMISEEKPKHYRDKKVSWSSLTEKQRLDWHMALISESRGGLRFSYSVIED